jgi:hypothetical protein
VIISTIRDKTLAETLSSSSSRDNGTGDALGAWAPPDYESNYVPSKDFVFMSTLRPTSLRARTLLTLIFLKEKGKIIKNDFTRGR